MRNGRQWKTPPANVPPPVMAPRTTGRPRPVSSPVSESPSENAMLTPAPSAVARPAKKAVRGWWVARTTAKIGASVESEPSMRPLSAGCTRCSRKLRSPSGGFTCEPVMRGVIVDRDHEDRHAGVVQHVPVVEVVHEVTELAVTPHRNHEHVDAVVLRRSEKRRPDRTMDQHRPRRGCRRRSAGGVAEALADD